MPSSGMDFSPDAKTTITYQDTNSWIPCLGLGSLLMGVTFKENLFACDRSANCKYLPIGNAQWLDAPSYEFPYRYYGTMAVVDNRVMLSGGRSSPSGIDNVVPLFV